MKNFFVYFHENYFNSSECLTFSVSIYLIFQFVFWFYNLFLLVIEMNDFPLIEQYRIQKKKKKLRYQTKILREMFRGTIEHQFSLIFSFPLLFYLLNRNGKIQIIDEFPSVSTMIYQILIFILIDDFLFYWTHLLFHTRWLYKTIHCKHHLYRQPTGLVFILSHPIESLIQNQIPVWFGPFLFKEKHLLTLSLWLFIRVYQTMNAHSGYDLPYITPQYYLPWLFSGTLEHDYHHEYSHSNFGSFFTIWDRLMKTRRLK